MAKNFLEYFECSKTRLSGSNNFGKKYEHEKMDASYANMARKSGSPHFDMFQNQAIFSFKMTIWINIDFSNLEP